MYKFLKRVLDYVQKRMQNWTELPEQNCISTTEDINQFQERRDTELSQALKKRRASRLAKLEANCLIQLGNFQLGLQKLDSALLDLQKNDDW